MADLALSLTATPDERLDQAEDLVRAYCGWHIFPSRSDTVTLDGSGGSALMLPTLNVTAVESVTSDGVAVTEFDWSQNGYLSLQCGRWSCRPRGVVVTMTHGYLTVPLEITGVVQAAAARAIASPNGAVREQSGPFAVTYSQTAPNQTVPLALLESEKAILDRYKLPPRP